MNDEFIQVYPVKNEFVRKDAQIMRINSETWKFEFDPPIFCCFSFVFGFCAIHLKHIRYPQEWPNATQDCETSICWLGAYEGIAAWLIPSDVKPVEKIITVFMT